MTHIKTISSQNLQATVKKADAVNARHPVSLLAKHPAQLATRFAKTTKHYNNHRWTVVIFLFREIGFTQRSDYNEFYGTG